MIKINFILGFLGAGKTTFIKTLLQNGILENERLILVVNDYGPENYDSSILSETGAEIIEITNGCLCCGNLHNFYETLYALSCRKDIDRIIIEPSGLFMPDQVIREIRKAPLNKTFRLEPIYVLVDMVFLSGATRIWPPFISRHIEIADYVVTNKQERINAEQVKDVSNRLQVINSKAGLSSFSKAIEQFNEYMHSLNNTTESISEGDHDVKFEVKTENMSFKDLDALKRYFDDQSDKLIRAKGFVEISGKKMFVNYTQNNVEVTTANSSMPPSLSCFYL